jgi:hypothetical protein
VSAHSAGAYTATLLVMVNVKIGGGRAPPTLTSYRTNFTLITECTPESSGCNSVYSVVIVVKGGGRAPLTLTSQANFTLMMECTPESGLYHQRYVSLFTTLCTLGAYSPTILYCTL